VIVVGIRLILMKLLNLSYDNKKSKWVWGILGEEVDQKVYYGLIKMILESKVKNNLAE